MSFESPIYFVKNMFVIQKRGSSLPSEQPRSAAEEDLPQINVDLDALIRELEALVSIQKTSIRRLQDRKQYEHDRFLESKGSMDQISLNVRDYQQSENKTLLNFAQTTKQAEILNLELCLLIQKRDSLRLVKPIENTQDDKEVAQTLRNSIGM